MCAQKVTSDDIRSPMYMRQGGVQTLWIHAVLTSSLPPRKSPQPSIKSLAIMNQDGSDTRTSSSGGEYLCRADRYLDRDWRP